MGELIKKDIFRKLGFNSANKWIFYDDRFQTFFHLFAERITDDNILSEKEVLEINDIKRREKFREDNEVEEIKSKLNEENPGFFNLTDDDVRTFEMETAAEEEVEKMYSNLIDEMSKTNTQVNTQLIDLEVNYNELESLEKKLSTECLDKATNLQEMQKNNKKLSDESKMCFTKLQSPPLFINQLPLDQYFQKCDLFLQYLTLYLKENFKIEDYEDTNINNRDDIYNITAQLEKNRKLCLYYLNKIIIIRGKIAGMENIIQNLDVNQIQLMNFTNIKKECHDLEMLNHHFVTITYQTLLNELEILLEQKTQNQMELILLENTKEKLNRATQRLENLKFLTKIVCDALKNAELVWIVAQLDLEKVKNRFNNNYEYKNEMCKCLKRIDIMRNFQSNIPNNFLSEIFVSQISEILLKHTTFKISNSSNSLLNEFGKFSRLVASKFDSILNQKQNGQHFSEILTAIHQFEGTYSSYVFDSPIKQPMYEIITFLESISKAKANQDNLKQNIRSLRYQFKENICERMKTDKLWRNSQLLWMWFLTEPKRVVMAIEEVRKIASKLPTLTGLKSLSGIKRM